MSVVSKYHESEEHMNIYEVPLTINVNLMWYFISAAGVTTSKHVLRAASGFNYSQLGHMDESYLL